MDPDRKEMQMPLLFLVIWTVFQAKIVGILMGVHLVIDLDKNKDIIISSDSIAALTALGKCTITSFLVYEFTHSKSFH